ncbi:maleate cis-trans isomerase family protein [Pseudaestuariivita atlantica]|uniref:Asp/Glu racemase n=1 Tax=Pseudaestuariivita atlantica TaxID=1317121 RepID=A0A0L1JNB8_9RHOB|nr:hypothetical protein [Pseudaestuariivita atlantica]KNG93249.1 hypothetical protein ATO11_12390 [Pseudaestuariivita atlantica]
MAHRPRTRPDTGAWIVTGAFPYALTDDRRRTLGLIVLQSDETVEEDLHRLCTPAARLLVSRVPSGTEVTTDTLAEMERHLTTAAGLFPRGLAFDAVGYACTSGSAVIGAETVARNIRHGVPADAVTTPVTALVAACRHAGAGRIALLSPYVADVSDRLRAVLRGAGIDTPAFGSFDEANEARVARIDAPSIDAAARAVAAQAPVDAVFLSCTNLRALDVLAPLASALDCPVWSSNLVLGWDLMRQAGVIPETTSPLDLLTGAG